MAASRHVSSGFVLVVTLWILAGIAVVVGLMTLWAYDEVHRATAEQESAADAIDAIGTRDTVLYIASTRGMTIAGLPLEGLSEGDRAVRSLDDMGALRRDPLGDELRVDGRVYAGLGSTSFAIQDEAGLFPLVYPPPAQLDAYLLARKVPPSDVPRLRDAFLDYVDLDPLNRVNGAERRDYERERRAGPANRRLLAPLELGRVLGWDKLPEATLDAMTEEVTPFYAGPVNLNAVPERLLPLWLTGCPDTCRLFTMRRSQQAFTSPADVMAKVGVRLAGDEAVDYRFAPSEQLRVSVWGRTGAGWQFVLGLTPLADAAAPWVVRAAYPVSRRPNDAPPEPIRSDLFTEAPGTRQRGRPAPAGRPARTYGVGGPA